MTTGESIPNSRELRGIDLFRLKGSEIVWNIDGTFSVPSRTRRSPKVTYTVDLRVGETGSCNCPDHQARGNACLHIYAATMKRAQLLAIAEKETRERKQRAEERKGERIVYTPEQAEKLIAGLDRTIS